MIDPTSIVILILGATMALGSTIAAAWYKRAATYVRRGDAIDSLIWLALIAGIGLGMVLAETLRFWTLSAERWVGHDKLPLVTLGVATIIAVMMIIASPIPPELFERVQRRMRDRYP